MAPPLWTKPKSEIKPEDYTDFYRSVAGQFNEPALAVHFRAEGKHEYTILAFVPGSKPFDLFDRDRKGRVKLYVKRVFITDELELLPRYLRFVRGLVDSADLPLFLDHLARVGLSPDPKSKVEDHYEVKVDSEWVRVPVDMINNVIAPDGGAHVCAPRQEGRNKGVLYCVILPSEG